MRLDEALRHPLFDASTVSWPTHLDAALNYAERGWPIFPLHGIKNGACTCGKPECGNAGKHPLTKNGFKDATSDARQIREWFARWPDANLGAAMGTTGNGHFGIDTDPRHGGDKTLSEVTAKLGPLPRTLVTLTGGGGSHHWFACRGVAFKSKANALGPGLDLKAEGGYLILPPSAHISGGAYRWQDYSAAPAELPKAWENFILDATKEQKQKLADGANGTGYKIPDGQRNTTLTSLAGSMRRKGVTAEEIFAVLLAVNATRCVSPLAEQEVRVIAFGVGRRYEPGPEIPDRLPITDISNAERLAAQFKEELAYLTDRKTWCAWNGRSWAVGDIIGVSSRMQKVARLIYMEAANEANDEPRKALGQWARKSESQKTQRDSIEAARPHLAISKFAQVFDRHPLLFNASNGTITEDGSFRPHSRLDYLTKIVETEYRADAACPQFTQFLDDTFHGNVRIVNYVTRLAGYFLTGCTTEQAWWMFHGPTASGKSTLVRILHGILGPYAMSLPEGYFLLSKIESRDFITASIAGARLCTCVETSEGRRLNVQRIKVLSGEDEISAEVKYQDLFQFRPQCKLVLVTNHPPHVPAGDDALWRRLKVVPFLATVPVEKRIPGLAERLLREEASGILNWALRGRREWQSDGLKEPAEVASAVATYRNSEDVIADFICECCVLEREAEETKKDVVAAFAEYAKENLLRPCSTKKLTQELDRFGVRVDPANKKYLGIRLGGR